MPDEERRGTQAQARATAKLKYQPNIASVEDCKFIEGNDFREAIRAGQSPYCGAPSEEGSSWCSTHKRRVYTRGRAEAA